MERRKRLFSSPLPIGVIHTIKAFSCQSPRDGVFGGTACEVAGIRIDLTRRVVVFFRETDFDCATALMWLVVA